MKTSRMDAQTSFSRTLTIPDMRMAKAYYACVFDAEMGDAGSCEMRVGDRRYMLSQLKPCAPMTFDAAVKDADVCAARIATKGGEIVTPVAAGADGCRRGSVRDPFGHLWRIESAAPR